MRERIVRLDLVPSRLERRAMMKEIVAEYRPIRRSVWARLADLLRNMLYTL